VVTSTSLLVASTKVNLRSFQFFSLGSVLESSLFIDGMLNPLVTIHVVAKDSPKRWTGTIIILGVVPETDKDVGDGAWCFYPRGHFHAEFCVKVSEVDRLWNAFSSHPRILVSMSGPPFPMLDTNIDGKFAFSFRAGWGSNADE
jgi:hypothetical protein